MTKVEPTITLPIVSHEQARLLKTGLTLVGVEQVEKAARLSSFLDHAAHPETQDAQLPASLFHAASQVSKLIIKAELEYMGGLVEHSRAHDVAIRIENDDDPVSKFRLLEQFLTVQPVEIPATQ